LNWLGLYGASSGAFTMARIFGVKASAELGRQGRDFKDDFLPYAHWSLSSSGTGMRLTTRRISGSSGAKEDPSKVLVSP